MIIEVCVETVESAIAAEVGGAHRLELNAALALDGLTPSLGLYRQVRATCSLPVIVMIRPRERGFVYSEYEFAAMLDDIDMFMDAGADGIAIGFLTQDLQIDKERTRQAVKRVGDKACVFHRAFDVTPSMFDALEALVDCGVTRILTSGQQPTAPAGSRQIKQLIERAEGRIEILPGAGIKPDNVRELVSQTGCTEVHGTFRQPVKNAGKLQGLDILKASPCPNTDPAIVKETLQQALDLG